MLNNHSADISTVQHLRHDLMIELGRLEMAMEDVHRQSANTEQPSTLESLQSKYARVSAALNKLPPDR